MQENLESLRGLREEKDGTFVAIFLNNTISEDRVIVGILKDWIFFVICGRESE